jgi:hypothetical protein
MRDTPVRDTLMRWPMEKHAYERHANGMAPLRDIPVRWPMRDARL